MGLYQTFGLPTDERDWLLMFLGKQAGKAGRNTAGQPMVIREDEREKTLVNLEMVRIKRRGERHEGLEVFVQDGKYGVMKDGKVTCKPEFAHISRISGGIYYAIATYPYQVFKNKSTVIGLSGQDLKASLYGRVTPLGEVIEGENIEGHRVFWDGIGNRYYSKMPSFETVGGMDMVCVGGKFQPRAGAYILKEPVGREDIWYNNDIVWMDKVVIIKKTGKVYPITAYGVFCFYVKNGSNYQDGILKVFFDGRTVKLSNFEFQWEAGMEDTPDWHIEQLTRASTGKLEYLNRSRKNKRKQVIVY